MKPTLLILAAGMGSRYGGLKQIDGFGPSGEAIIEYSIYDAIRAGFGKVVFVIRKSIEEPFKAYFKGKFEDQIEIGYAYQEIDNVPKGIEYSPERKKPWGTGHAVMVAEAEIDTPFAMINADDFYGKEAYDKMAEYLIEAGKEANPSYCIMGYKLKNTLSDHGFVSRGDCEVNEEGFLIKVTERTHIERIDGAVKYKDENGNLVPLSEDTIVSMNMMGFMPNVFEHLQFYFAGFIKENGFKPKSEFYVPNLLTHVINDEKETVKVLSSDATWFGVTYQEDKPSVIGSINSLVEQGVYPKNLWA